MKRMIFLIILLFSISAFSQYYSGEIGFNYLNVAIAPSSQSFSTAGAAAIERVGDCINPASLYFYREGNETSVNYMNYLAGSHFGLMSYYFSKSQIYLKYFNSGLIERRDSLNTDLGTYTANVLMMNYSKSFLLNEKMIYGFGINLGIENITEYNGISASFDIGFIYKNLYSDFLSAGINISNIGLVYDFEEKSMTPAKIVAGISISKEDMPFAIYIDAGKIIDREYFYAGGMEFYLIRSKTEEKDDVAPLKDIKVSVSDIPKESLEVSYTDIEAESSNAISISLIDTVSLLDTLNVSMQEEKTNDSLTPVDSMSISSQTEMKTDTIKKEEETYEYKSYADYLEDELNDTLLSKENILFEDTTVISDEIKSVEQTEQIYTHMKKISVMDPLTFSFRWGFSSDREQLTMGYGSDLFAGLTTGFKMSYETVSVNYTIKMWGELGTTQTIGLDFRF